MKFTYNWLKDFVEIRISPDKLAEKLTSAGLEVVSLEEKEGDFIFEIEVTSNRPDWLSVLGIAREVSAITGARLKFKERKEKILNQKRYSKELVISIENKKSCPLYEGILIDNLKVKESPSWLKKRLELVGLRSINNVVDITNYILLGWGQPLHAFDFDKITQIAKTFSPLIFVRQANRDEKITTLDGIERILDKDILLITAGKTKEATFPIAIAGIMGDKETEVAEDTRKILLESAIFDPILIRRGKRKLGIETASSYRFERGVDLDTHRLATLEALLLLEDICGGKICFYKTISSLKPKNTSIILNFKKVEEFLGREINKEKIRKIFSGLGIKIILGYAQGIKVKIPEFRQDLKEEVDLIEEIARIEGYEKIPLSIPKILPKPKVKTDYDLVNYIKDILVGLGFDEVITYSLMSKGNLFNEIKEPLEILNPLSSQQDILRPTLLPRLLECVAYNFHQHQEYVNIFEIAKIYFKTDQKPEERLTLAVVVSGIKSFLSEQGLIRQKLGFLHLKAVIENLAEKLGINFALRLESDKVKILVKEKIIGEIINIPQHILEQLDIKHNQVWALEVDLEEILRLIDLEKKFIPLPCYPGIRRDISLIAKEGIFVQEILDFIKKETKDLLSEVKIIDYYKGKQIPPGFKGLTISCIYQSKERTLTEKEINPLHQKICEALTQKFNITIRA